MADYRANYRQVTTKVYSLPSPTNMVEVLKVHRAIEVDPLRYGGDQREGSDEFWGSMLADYDLFPVILHSDDRWDRVDEALLHLDKLFDGVLSYDRITKETLGV